MKNIFLAVFFLFMISSSGCNDDYFDPLGDLIIQLQRDGTLPDHPLFNEIELGVFPSESLLTNTFTSDFAFKTAAVDTATERIVFTNILPGTYVVAFIPTTSNQNVPKQVVQVIADKVTVADLYF